MRGAFVAMAGKRKSSGGGSAGKQKISRGDSSASLVGDIPPYFEQMMTWFFGILKIDLMLAT